MNIVVAEDHAPSRYLLEQVLAAPGHVVRGAANGAEAITLCERLGAPDLLITDALMPEMDGFQLCHQLRRHATLCAVPVLMYTATYVDESDERFALAVGADRYLVKPVEPPRLLAVIGEMMEAARVRPMRQPLSASSQDSFLLEYSRRLSMKLEKKLDELSRANGALSQSEASVRELNQRLSASVSRLEHEVADRRRAEELLRLAQTVGGIGSWGDDFSWEGAWWSDEACRIVGVPVGSPVPPIATMLAMIAVEDRARVLEVFRRGAETGEGGEVEVQVHRPDGQKRLLQVRSEVFSDTMERPVRRIGTVQDITLRRQTEVERIALEQRIQQAGKMEAVGHLAGGIAHDFNNILTAILGNAEILQMGLAREGGGVGLRDNIGEISKACMRARDLVNQILTFSRRQTVERRRIVLAPVVEEALGLVRVALPPGIDLRVDLKSRRAVMANENQLHQVVMNLCTNAVQAMEQRGGVLAVTLVNEEIVAGQATLRTTLRPGTYLRLDVSDEGCGIDAATIEHIFEPFFTTKRPGQGTGLGLAVVHGIVQAHAGGIFVESQPSKGTVFMVYLPTVESAPEAAATSPRASVPGAGQRILFVDDEPAVAKITGTLLNRLGYQAETLCDPVQARDRFLSSPEAFDLVITDYLMPRLNGLDLARALWTARPDLPIILAVGFGGQMDAGRAGGFGFRDFISKPFTLQGLADVVARALRE